MTNPLTLLTAELRRRFAGINKTLKQHTAQLSNHAEALIGLAARTQRFNTTIGPLVIGSEDVTVTWPSPWPDAAYWVGVELITGAAALGNLHATVKAGSKTTDGCIVTVSALAAVATVGVDVLGVRT